jgi:hypothetical protein
MKSVSLSQVVRSQQADQPLQSWREVVGLGMTLSFGLVLIAVVLMAADPGAPAAWIVIPVLLGGSLPLLAAAPGQFDVYTRFDAAHFLNNLDASLRDMGYVATDAADARRRSYRRPTSLLRWQARQLTLSIHQHAITISGPLPALRQLQHRLNP